MERFRLFFDITGLRYLYDAPAPGGSLVRTDVRLIHYAPGGEKVVCFYKASELRVRENVCTEYPLVSAYWHGMGQWVDCLEYRTTTIAAITKAVAARLGHSEFSLKLPEGVTMLHQLPRINDGADRVQLELVFPDDKEQLARDALKAIARLGPD